MPAKQRAAWTVQDDIQLLQRYIAGDHRDEVAVMFQRTATAVQQRFISLGLPSGTRRDIALAKYELDKLMNVNDGSATDHRKLDRTSSDHDAMSTRESRGGSFSGRHWTAAETQLLREMFEARESCTKICTELQRTPEAIKKKLNRLNYLVARHWLAGISVGATTGKHTAPTNWTPLNIAVVSRPVRSDGKSNLYIKVHQLATRWMLVSACLHRCHKLHLLLLTDSASIESLSHITSMRASLLASDKQL